VSGPSVPSVSNKKKRILAVDADATALGTLRQILLQKGYEITAAATGEEALARMGSESFDLVILDVVLPGLSGFELCRRIRQEPGTCDVPIIFLTAKGLLMDMAEGDDAGSDLYLIKPVLASKLLRLIELFLSDDKPLARRKPLPKDHQ
jgi:DNA-binding response OmpR family regulator